MKTGLSWRQRILVRRRIRRAMFLMLKNAGRVHYTQGPRRWSGINGRKRSYKGEFPAWSDCSSSSTWAVWDACLKYIRNGTVKRDFVNGQDWKRGYTGTMITHGKRIRRPSMVGDMVFYGQTHLPSHVAVYVGGGRVISQGSEGGPYLLRWDYRGVAQVRRYIR